MGYIIIVAIIISIIFYIAQKRKKQVKYDNEIARIMSEVREAAETLRSSTGLGEIDNIVEDMADDDFVGYGEFGYDVTNPILVKGVAGARTYFQRLRTSDGLPISHRRIGSTSAPNLDHLVDMYNITANNEPMTILYVYMYSNKFSQEAPRDFKIIT